MNKSILMGRLVRDPEVRVTPSEKTVCTFTLAVSRPFKGAGGKQEADFINIVVWGKIAEVCGNSLAKGHRLLVEGRLQIRSYEAKDGSKRYVTEVIANSVDFIEQKSHAVAPPPEQPSSSMDGFGTNVEEEIPF